jgi:hypothetical protein
VVVSFLFQCSGEMNSPLRQGFASQNACDAALAAMRLVMALNNHGIHHGYLFFPHTFLRPPRRSSPLFQVKENGLPLFWHSACKSRGIEV